MLNSRLVIAHEHFFDFTNCSSWIQTLGAGLGAVHDGVATVDGEAVLHHGQPLVGVVVPRVDHPAVGLHEDGRAQVLVRVPPVAGAGGAAAGAQDALVEAVQFSTVLDGLQVLLLSWNDVCIIPLLQVGLNRAVLGIKVAHVRYQILDHIHVGQRVHKNWLVRYIIDLVNAGQSVGAINIHRARAADALTARPSEGQGRVHLIFYLYQGIQNHRTALVEVDVIGLHPRFVTRLLWIPSVDFEFFYVLRLICNHSFCCRLGKSCLT